MRVETRPRPADDATQAVVRFELPAEVVEEVRAECDGDLDRDEISDRIVPVPLADGEPV